MKAYRLLVHDDRSALPQVWNAEMGGDARVAQFCRDRIAHSDHVASIEVWSGARRLCHIRGERREAA
jgi:hypothetical protein